MHLTSLRIFPDKDDFGHFLDSEILGYSLLSNYPKNFNRLFGAFFKIKSKVPAQAR